MNKYFDKTGKEVRLGLPFALRGPGSGFAVEDILTEKIAQMLVTLGILTVETISEKASVEKTPLQEEAIPMDLDFYVSLIGQAAGWKPQGTKQFLQRIGNLYPQALFTILLRAIAEYLDQRYPDHIKNSPEIWVLNAVNGKIGLLGPKVHKNFKSFAAFRTKEDAGIACRILRDLKREIYGSRK